MATRNTQLYPVLTGIVKLKGGRILDSEGKFVADDLWFDTGLQSLDITDENQDHGVLYDPLCEGNATIIDPKSRFWDANRCKDFSAHNVLNISGFLVIPGYIDIQTNGSFGLDYTTVPEYDEKGLIKRTTLQNDSDIAENLTKLSLKSIKQTHNVPKFIHKTQPLHITLSRANSTASNASSYYHTDSSSRAINLLPGEPSGVSIASFAESNDNCRVSGAASNSNTLDYFNFLHFAEREDIIPVSAEHLHPHKARTLINAITAKENNSQQPTPFSSPGITTPQVTTSGLSTTSPLSTFAAVPTSTPQLPSIACITPSTPNVPTLYDFDLLPSIPSSPSYTYTQPPFAYNFDQEPFLELLQGTPSFSTLRHVLYEKDQDMLYVNEQLPRYGVTSLCPTIISSDQPTFHSTGRRVIEYMLAVEQGRKQGLIVRQANMLGIHLEGPFISVPGAHKQSVLGSPVDYSHIEMIYNGKMMFPFTSIVTLAPEMAGALEVTKALSQQGIIVSMGHSQATVDQAKKGIDAGAQLVTHMFNAMRSFHHRDPGLIGVLGANQPYNIHFSIISDGYHAHPFSVNIAYSSSPDKLILVTDSMSAMGLPNGKYKLGTEDVTMIDNKAVLTNSPANLAGAVVPLDQCVRNFINFTNCEPAHAIMAATKAPAELLGIYPRKGSLLPGSDADIVLLDPKTFEVAATFVNGQLCYVNKSSISALFDGKSSD